MRKIIALSWVALVALSSACGENKTQDKPEIQGQGAKVEELSNSKTNADAKKEPVAQKLIDLYPPSIGVYPLSAPAPGRSLYFGFSADGTQKFEMIWVYAVAAVPNFDKALAPPNFATDAEYITFMDKWTAEFTARPEMVASLNKLATEFSFKVDPLLFNDAAYTIPKAFSDSMLPFEKATQKYFARRYTTKAAGATTISALVDGATFSVPVTITNYTNAQLSAGKTRYDAAATGNPATAGCVGCHGNATTSQDAFLKHSSDYLAYVMDAEVLNIMVNAAYPNGMLLNNGAHKFTFADAAAESAIIGYLRSFAPSIDKLEGVATQASALRLR
jgi:cytochrome c553